MNIKQAINKVNHHFSKFPKRACIWHSNENVKWNFLINCKNSESCFDSLDLEDSKYCANIKWWRDCYDINRWGRYSELCYEASAIWENTLKVLFSEACWNWVSDTLYSLFCCNNCSNLFWCIWLKQKSYCIFNKQYTKEEYEKIVPQIIEHMQKTWEWWEFFPIELSPFAYNETTAQDYYPLTKEQCLDKWYKWKDEDDQIPNVEKVIPAKKLPDNIKDIPDDILNWAIKCEVSKRPFKLIPQELKFYRKHNIPVPHLHPDERHKARMKLRNPRKLFDRQCVKCEKDIQTTYSPDRSEIVYCEECYLKEVY